MIESVKKTFRQITESDEAPAVVITLIGGTMAAVMVFLGEYLNELIRKISPTWYFVHLYTYRDWYVAPTAVILFAMALTVLLLCVIPLCVIPPKR